MSEQHPVELIPALVAGVLEGSIAAQVRAHLSVCAACRAEAEIMHALLQSGDDQTGGLAPRAHVKRTLLARVAADTRSAAPRPLWRRPAALLAGALAIAIAITGIALDSHTRPALLAAVSAALPSAAGTALGALIATPGTAAHRIDAPTPADLTGTVYVRAGDQRIGVVLQHLPPAPAGHVYRLWLADGAAVLPCSTLAAQPDGSASLLCVAPQTIDHYSDLMVSLDPAGEASVPGELVLFQIKL